MSSNIAVVKYLLGRYGLFQPGTFGNSNATPLLPSVQQGQTGPPIPANASTAGSQAIGSQVTNGNYAGQGIQASSFDTGPLFFQQCTGWQKWGIQARADIPGNNNQIQGLIATIYGTWDWDTACGNLTTYSATTGLRSSGNENWVQLATPSQQSGDGNWVNPLVNTSQGFWTNVHVLAIRILVSALTGGSVLFAVTAIP